MNADMLLNYYDRIAEAPDAVLQLRQFVIDLAVRGKIVPQEPTDEPASQLIARIGVEKARLANMGSIRPEKALAPVGDDVDFRVPSTWQWTRLGVITSYIQRGKSPKYTDSNGPLVVSQKCIQWSGLDLKAAKQITPESLAEYDEIRFLRDNDLLWNSTGTGTIGRVIRLVNPPDKLVCDSHVTVVRCLIVDSEYVRVWLRSSFVYGMIEERAAGSTNQIELTAQMAVNQTVPLPPLAEQHRIVARVNELMDLCDQLEARNLKRESIRDRLIVASVSRLGYPVASSEDLANFSSLVIEKFEHLTARSEHIKALRQAVLSLAVTGKLVPQISADESALELLSKIHGSRKIKRKMAQISHQTISKLPFDIPKSWSWTTIDQLSDDSEDAITDGPFGSQLKTEHYIETPGYRVIRLQNIGHGIFRKEHRAYIDKSRFERLTKHHVKPGDLVVAGLVDPAIRCCEVPNDIGPSLVKADCYRLSVHRQVSKRYVLYYLNSLIAQDFASVHHHGMTLTRIGLGNFRHIPVPLPPLAEQHRIVAKVEELMHLCDRLESNLSAITATRSRLLRAVLHRALAEDVSSPEAA